VKRITVVGREINEGGAARTTHADRTHFALALERGIFCSALRAPHRGTSLGPFVCGANYRLYLISGKVAIAAMYLRRVRVAGRSFAAALTYFSTAVTPRGHAACACGRKLRHGPPAACQGQASGGRAMPLSVSPTEFNCDFLKSSFFVVAVFLSLNRVVI
jgi:hypothetical protein